MDINVTVDKEILDRAVDASLNKERTVKEIVERALIEYRYRRTRSNLSELFGKIEFAEGYDPRGE